MKLLLLDLFNADLSPLARTEIRKAGGAEGVASVGCVWGGVRVLFTCCYTVTTTE